MLKLEKSIWATTCDFQQCGLLTSVDSDESVQPPFKLRNSKCSSASSWTFIEFSSDLQRLWSDCAYAQAGLSLAGRTYHIVGNLMSRLIIYIQILSFMELYVYRTFQYSVVECLTWDKGVAGSSLIGVTALCPWARHINPCLELVQPRNSWKIVDWDIKNQTKQTNSVCEPWLIYWCLRSGAG